MGLSVFGSLICDTHVLISLVAFPKRFLGTYFLAVFVMVILFSKQYWQPDCDQY